MTTATRPADAAPMIEWALWYASMGWAIMPLHQPLFDDTGSICGCTCEAWKRENRDPEYACPTPGKHPIHSAWEDKATTDPDQIRRWWRRWPQANIGLAVGKSGLLTLDFDAYKDTFDGGDLLDRADEETITQLSGGGGSHLLYVMPEGKAWGNHRGNLPTGIDVRGVGGMQVLAPSLHPSGNRYQWELDYGPDEIQPLPVPALLAEILDNAAAKATKAAAVHFDQVTTARPDLAALHLAAGTVDAINTAPAKGGRSEHDMRVVVALCYAGLSDTDILAVFEHYPIGARGKFAESGQQYLAHTIGKARAYVDANPPQSSGVVDPGEVRAEIARLKEWAASTHFGEIVPKELITGPYYVTDSVDHKVYDAVLDVAATYSTMRVYVSRRSLALRAGVGSHKTAQRALERLRNLLTVEDDGCIVVMSREDDPLEPQKGDNLVGHPRATYSERKADDPFLSGVSRAAKALGNEESALGESVLRIIDALEKCGAMTRAELVESAGKTKGAVARATLRAERLGLLSAYQEHKKSPKVYELNLDWAESVATLTPSLKTYLLGAERAERHYSGVIADRIEHGKSTRDSDMAALVVALVELYDYGEAEARRRVAEYAHELNRLCLNVKMDDDQRRSRHLIVQYEKRQERIAAARVMLSALEPNMVLSRVPIAQIRQAAGRVGVQPPAYSEDLYSAQQGWRDYKHLADYAMMG